MKEPKEIPISYVFFWIAFIILIILLAWRTFGSSPTVEAISFGATIFGTVLTWIGLQISINSTENFAQMQAQHAEQTEILKDIKDLFKEKLK